MKLVLHNYWRSSASHRVRIALAWKGIAYEYVAVNIMKAEHDSASYRAMNAMQQVPTLEVIEDDGSRSLLTQSLPILEYIEERWPEPSLMPRDRTLRQHTRALAEIVNSGIQPLQNLSVLKALKELGADSQAWPKPWIAKGLAAYAQAAAERAGTFSVGDSPTIADCCLIPQLVAARRWGAEFAHLDVLVRIENNCLALPAFAAAAPDLQPDAVKS